MVTAFSGLSRATMILLAAGGLAACDTDSPKTGSQPAATKPSVVDAASADGDETRFDVRVEAPTAAPAGRESLAKVHVEPRSPWHMNTEFPVALRVTAPNGVELDVAKQRKSDAERFDDDGLVFALPFTPKTQGAKRIAGEVDFAVCGDAACAPETVAVDFVVEVGCGTDAMC